MSLQDLAPVNSQKACATSLNVFKRFLEAEGSSLEVVRSALLGDPSGSAFVRLMDRFAMHLAFSNGRGGQPLARNTVMGYYRHVKNWLLDDCPQQRQAIETKLLKMDRILERYCFKRLNGGVVKKAPACTKEDISSLIDGLYYDATSPKDYQDAALMLLMWYAFGRSSDLAFVRNSSLTVTASNVLYLRLIRVKTSEEQGLSLVPDHATFITCPLHAIGVALAMQSFPIDSLLDHPQLESEIEAYAPALLSEVTLLQALTAASGGDEKRASGSEKRSSQRSMKIHAYVNRIVNQASKQQERANITANLSSHSFRRGGAQHANSDSGLSAQWIFDRESWNMSATNKAFAYVFNMTAEDLKVARVLSGWDANDKPKIPSPNLFDSNTRRRISSLAELLFASSVCLQGQTKTLDPRVTGLLVPSLIQHFPEVNKRYADSPYAKRMRNCLSSLDIRMPELLVWSSALQTHATRASAEPQSSGQKFTKEARLINHQKCVINSLLDTNRQLAARLEALEQCLTPATSNTNTAPPRSSSTTEPATSAAEPAQIKKRHAAKASAAALWFEWYTKTPRLWEACCSKQYKSQSKTIVGFMKLFLPDGFELDPTAADYPDSVMATGKQATERMMAFFGTLGVKHKYGSGLLNKPVELHRSRTFEDLISAYRTRVAVGRVVDPAPDAEKVMF